MVSTSGSPVVDTGNGADVAGTGRGALRAWGGAAVLDLEVAKDPLSAAGGGGRFPGERGSSRLGGGGSPAEGGATG